MLLNRNCHCGEGVLGWWGREAQFSGVPSDPIPSAFEWVDSVAGGPLHGGVAINSLPSVAVGSTVQLPGLRMSTVWPSHELTNYTAGGGLTAQNRSIYYNALPGLPSASAPVDAYSPAAPIPTAASHLSQSPIELFRFRQISYSGQSKQFRIRYIRPIYDGNLGTVFDLFDDDPSDWARLLTDNSGGPISALDKIWRWPYTLPFSVSKTKTTAVDLWIEYQATATGADGSILAYEFPDRTIEAQFPFAESFDSTRHTFKVEFFGNSTPDPPENEIIFGTDGGDTVDPGYLFGRRTVTLPPPYTDWDVHLELRQEMPRVTLRLVPFAESLEGIFWKHFWPTENISAVKQWYYTQLPSTQRWRYMQHPGGVWNLQGSRQFDGVWPKQENTTGTFTDQAHVNWPTHCVVTRQDQ